MLFFFFSSFEVQTRKSIEKKGAQLTRSTNLSPTFPQFFFDISFRERLNVIVLGSSGRNEKKKIKFHIWHNKQTTKRVELLRTPATYKSFEDWLQWPSKHFRDLQFLAINAKLTYLKEYIIKLLLGK